MSQGFKQGDIRTYQQADLQELMQEHARLRQEIQDPKLRFGEKAGAALYNSIVLGFTLALPVFAGGAIALHKSKHIQKLFGFIGEDAQKGIASLKNVTEAETYLKGNKIAGLEKVKAAVNDGEEVGAAVYKAVAEHNGKAVKRFLYTATAASFGGPSIVGTYLSIDKAKAGRAVENASQLGHVERVLAERTNNTQPLVQSEPQPYR